MKRLRARLRIAGAVVVVSAAVAVLPALQQPAQVTIDYPEEGSIFPPEITAPAFLWRDTAESAKRWRIDITFGDGSAAIHAESPGQRLRIGEIDPRTVAATNELPKLSPQLAAAWTWTPDAETWSAIKRHSVKRPATVTITGLSDRDPNRAVSAGSVHIQTSSDPVGAPIFYRDVPLMPSELEKGVILVRNMRSGKQAELPLDTANLADKLQGLVVE